MVQVFSDAATSGASRFAELAEALHHDDNREALELVRGLVERVVVTPLPEGSFEIELVGAIAAMVRLGLGPDAQSRRAGAAAGADLFACSVMVVAGEGNFRWFALPAVSC